MCLHGQSIEIAAKSVEFSHYKIIKRKYGSAF